MTNSDAATSADITATANGITISSGDAVKKGTVVTINAVGVGAGSYTYAWTGIGTAGTIAPMLKNTWLNGKIEASCVVSGTGVPTDDPDYKINDCGYTWSGSDETVVLSGTNDTLDLLKAPAASAKVQIDVRSADGSTVKINGNSLSCVNTRITVFNDITLKIDNLVLTAPDGYYAMLFSKIIHDSEKATLEVSGTCSVTGSERFSAIHSQYDQEFTITGNGTLNATGGNSPDTSGAGSGISLEGYFTGGIFGYAGKLTITGGITINATGGNAPSSSGGRGISAGFGDIEINNATLHAFNGTSAANSSTSAIGTSFSADNNAQGGSLTIINSTVTATGAGNSSMPGGQGFYVDNNLVITDSTVDAKGGSSVSNTGGVGIFANEKNITINASGGESANGIGGYGISAKKRNITFSNSHVTAKGGMGISNGAIAINCDIGNISVTGGNVTAYGGEGTAVNGSHAVYASRGSITIGGGADVTAIGGNGKAENASAVGGVGIRAFGYNDATTPYSGTVTILNDAGAVYVRGGQGAAAQRDSIMGRNVYIGTGNIGSVHMETGTGRSIKNSVGGDDVFLVSAANDPAAAVEYQTAVTGALAGNYTYKSKAGADGKAYMWLPAGAQAISASGYQDTPLSVETNDTSAVTLKVPSPVNPDPAPAPAPAPVQTAQTSKIVEVNGEKQDAGNSSVVTTATGQKQETIKVDDTKLDKILAAKGEKPTVTLPASKGNYQIVVKPVDFEITCTSGLAIVDVSKFNGYVERTIAIPDGIDPKKITTGVVLNADGTLSHVPTEIIVINGKYFAKINSLTNSTYSVVWNPVTFADVANHWAKDAVNDMGSRMVVTGMGDGTYEPDRSITRAEFAAIAVRALGLKKGVAESAFTDVSVSDWFNGYVDKATEYGLITGYNSQSYGPNDAITREQVMAIIARAMKLTGLKVSMTDGEVTELLASYNDGSTVSDYAKASVASCIKAGLITGTSATAISPKADMTRAEVAVIVQRLLQKSGLI